VARARRGVSSATRAATMTRRLALLLALFSIIRLADTVSTRNEGRDASTNSPYGLHRTDLRTGLLILASISFHFAIKYIFLLFVLQKCIGY